MSIVTICRMFKNKYVNTDNVWVNMNIAERKCSAVSNCEAECDFTELHIGVEIKINEVKEVLRK